MSGCKAKTIAMKQDQCSKVNIKYTIMDSDVLSSDSHFLPNKVGQQAIHSNITCLALFSVSLLYLNLPSEA